jgi:hypothetical protein
MALVQLAVWNGWLICYFVLVACTLAIISDQRIWWSSSNAGYRPTLRDCPESWVLQSMSSTSNRNDRKEKHVYWCLLPSINILVYHLFTTRVIFVDTCSVEAASAQHTSPELDLLHTHETRVIDKGSSLLLCAATWLAPKKLAIT